MRNCAARGPDALDQPNGGAAAGGRPYAWMVPGVVLDGKRFPDLLRPPARHRNPRPIPQLQRVGSSKPFHDFDHPRRIYKKRSVRAKKCPRVQPPLELVANADVSAILQLLESLVPIPSAVRPDCVVRPPIGRVPIPPIDFLIKSSPSSFDSAMPHLRGGWSAVGRCERVTSCFSTEAVAKIPWPVLGASQRNAGASVTPPDAEGGMTTRHVGLSSPARPTGTAPKSLAHGALPYIRRTSSTLKRL